MGSRTGLLAIALLALCALPVSAATPAVSLPATSGSSEDDMPAPQSARPAVGSSSANSAARSASPESVRRTGSQQSLIEDGLYEISAARYELAADFFREAVRQQPSDSHAHYYLANALVYLHRHDEAIAEYRESYRLDPYGTVSGYCRRALVAYKAALPPALGKGEEATPLSQETAGGAPSKTVANYLPATEMSGAIEKIRHDAEGEKTRHKKVADQYSTVAIRAGEVEAGKILENARIEIDRIMHPPLTMPDGRMNPAYLHPEVMKAEADDVRRNAEEAARIARDMAQEKSQSYAKWNQGHSKLLDESADNLEHLLSGKTLPGTPKLTPDGTGLFVRNYSTAASSKVSDYHQGIARIRPALTGPQRNGDDQSEDGLKAKQASGNDDQKNEAKEDSSPTSDVRGKIVR